MRGEDPMTSERMDYSILDKFEFKYAPVGVKFCPVKPEGMEKLDKKIARATAYSAGEMFNSRMTYVMGCAWLYNYPYVTGESNYLTTGVAYGMKMYELLPGGMQIVSIPYDRIERSKAAIKKCSE
jgi:hypothetical protein